MVARSLAIFFACLSVLGFTSRFRDTGFDPTLLWLDLRAFDWAAGLAILTVAAISFIAIAWPRPTRWMSLIPGLLALVATADAVRFYALLYYERIDSSFPIALSALVAVALGWVAARPFRLPPVDPSATRPWWKRAGSVTGCLSMAAVWATAFALLQMWCYGKTDYARKSDAIVVLGARVYADGRLSTALADRVQTGIDLYKQGLAPKLIFSGGPGDGSTDEPAAMRAFAIAQGVPPEAIEEDDSGVNTRATIRYLSAQYPDKQILAVSHFYHLPRIKIEAQKYHLNLVTSPAVESYTLSQLPKYVAREVAAFWVYLLR